MESRSSFPEEIRKFIPCSHCYLRENHGIYSVYRYDSVRLPNGRRGRNAGFLIGKIIPGEGFVPNERYLKEQEKAANGFTDLSYGPYALFLSLAEDIRERLEECFPAETAAWICAFSLILAVKGFYPLEEMEDFYRESILPLVFPEFALPMNPEGISRLLRDLGSHGIPAGEFKRRGIEGSSGKITVEETPLSFSEDVNVLMLTAFDRENGMPLLYHIYSTEYFDSLTAEEFLEDYNLQGGELVIKVPGVQVFPGRSGEKSRVVSLSRQDPDAGNILDHQPEHPDQFLHTDREGDWLISWWEEKREDGMRVLCYRNEDVSNSLQKKCLADKAFKETCSREDTRWFGIEVLLTGSTASPEEVYRAWKRQVPPEIHDWRGLFDILSEDYYCIRGFEFILLVSEMFRSRLVQAISSAGIKASYREVLLRSSRLRLVQEETRGWKLYNERGKDRDLLTRLGYPWTQVKDSGWFGRPLPPGKEKESNGSKGTDI